MVMGHTVLGVGLDNCRLSNGHYAAVARADPRVHSNNMYIELAAGGGVIVFAAFLWLLQAAAGCAASLVGTAGAAANRAARGAGLAAAMLPIARHRAVASVRSFGPTYVR